VTEEQPAFAETDPELTATEFVVSAGDEPSLPLPAEAPPPTVVRGAVWTIAGFGVMQVLRFGSSLILTRLVSQYVFGVMNLVNLFIQGLHMFSDLGIRQCVVNSKRGDDPMFLNTAWTIQVIRGVVLWGLTLLVCWPLSRLYNTPQMLWLVPIVGITACLDGFTSSAAFTMSRRLERAKLVVREVAAYAISMAAAVVWLWMIRPVDLNDESAFSQQMLAFAVCNVLSSFLELGLSYTLIRGARNQFMWDSAAARELARFGGWIFVSTACTFLAANLDRLYIGKLDKAVLANYHIAAQLARLPTLLLLALGHQLVFPLYSRLLREGVQLHDSFARVHVATTGFAGWLAAGAFAVCPSLIWLVYREEYRPAGDYVRWLSIAAWFTILQTSSEVVLLSQGLTRQVATGQFVKLVLLAPLLLAGFQIGGFIGVIVGYTLAEAARYVVLSTELAKQKLPVFRLDWMMTMLVAVTAGLTILAGPSFEGVGGQWSRYGWRFLFESMVLSAMWAGIAYSWWRRNGAALLALIRPPGAAS
jgi:O-antigen/teichoic acid export membrane protein